MCKRSENTGKKPVARKGKQRLAWDATVCTYTRQRQQELQKMAWEAENVGMIKDEGTSENADRKRATKESDYKSIETSEIFLVSICILPITTLETGGIALIIRNVLFTLCVETHPNSAEPYALENK